MPNQVKYKIVLTRADYAILEGIVTKYKSVDGGERVVYRAETIIMSARGFTDDEIVAKLHIGHMTVLRQRKAWCDPAFHHLSFEDRLRYKTHKRKTKSCLTYSNYNNVSERANPPQPCVPPANPRVGE